MRDDPLELIERLGRRCALIDEAEAVAPHLRHADCGAERRAGGVRDQADGVERGDIRISGQRNRNTALAEGLLDPLEDGTVKTLDLLGRGLTAKEVGDMSTVVPRQGVAGRDRTLLWVGPCAQVQEGIYGTGDAQRTLPGRRWRKRVGLLAWNWPRAAD